MKRLLLYLLALLPCWCAAQAPYKRTYDFGGSEWAVHSIPCDSVEKSLLVLTSTYDPSATGSDSLKYYQTVITKLDSFGNIAYEKRYGRDKYDYLPGRYYQLEDGRILMLMVIRDSLSNQDQRLFLLDNESFDTVSSVSIPFPTPQHRLSDILYKEGKFYLVGKTLSATIGSPLFLMIYDTAGSILKYKELPHPTDRIFDNIVLADDGKILFSGLYAKEADGMKRRGWYGLLDSSGSIEWDRIMDDSVNFFYDQYKVWVSRSGSDYYVSGGQSNTLPFYNYINKIDLSDGSVYWRKKFYEGGDSKAALFGFFRPKDQHLYNIGQFVEDVGTGTERQYAVLTKVTSEGNMVWKRTFSEGTFNNITDDYFFARDGFVLFGSAMDITHPIGQQDAWVIKTDSFGCVVPGCQLHDGIPQVIGSKVSFFAYPNPVSSEIHLSFISQQRDLAVRIIDLTGNESYTQKLSKSGGEAIINISALHEGIWIMQIFSGNQLIGKQKISIIK